MAQLTLERARLPDCGTICLRCGGPATCTIERRFTYTPRVAKTLPAKWKAPQSCAVHLPMCDDCQSHWLRYNIIVILVVLLLLASWVVWSVVVYRVWGSILDIRNQTGTGVWFIGLLGIAAVVICAAAWLVHRPIRAREITRTTVKLTGVADSIPGAEPELRWWASTTRERRLAALASKNAPPCWVLGAAMVAAGALFFFLGEIPARRGPPLTGAAARIVAGSVAAFGALIFGVSWVRRKRKASPKKEQVAAEPEA
jgi:hypothetical protein